MATIRAYLNLTDTKVENSSGRGDYLVLNVNGHPAKQNLMHDVGRWFITLNGSDPHIPTELLGCVTHITSIENLHDKFGQTGLIKAGKYQSRSSKCTAEVERDYVGGGEVGLRITIRALNLHAWKQFHGRLIAGELTPTRSYERKVADPAA